MREDDRALVCEIHPEQARLLRQNLTGDRRFGVHHRDGYEALEALLPPTPRRGVVLIDPPYEDADEFGRLLPALEKGARRWPTGIFVVWYPIKHRRELRGFYRSLAAAGLGPVLLAELAIRPADSGGRSGSSAASGRRRGPPGAPPPGAPRAIAAWCCCSTSVMPPAATSSCSRPNGRLCAWGPDTAYPRRWRPSKKTGRSVRSLKTAIPKITVGRKPV